MNGSLLSAITLQTGQRFFCYDYEQKTYTMTGTILCNIGEWSVMFKRFRHASSKWLLFVLLVVTVYGLLLYVSGIISDWVPSYRYGQPHGEAVKVSAVAHLAEWPTRVRLLYFLHNGE